MSATTSLPCSNIKPFRTGITAPHRPLRDPSTTNPKPQKQYHMLGIGAGIGRVTADVLHLVSDVVHNPSTTNPELQKWYRMLDIGAGIGHVTADILHLVSDVVHNPSTTNPEPQKWYRMLDIGAGIDRVIVDVLHLVSDVVLLRGYLGQEYFVLPFHCYYLTYLAADLVNWSQLSETIVFVLIPLGGTGRDQMKISCLYFYTYFPWRDWS
ncbi:hypothetical protein EV363DRAFT_1162635 [Boletus edulis]|nr:hypothetical protein EV363DRAFT_1162635 [Boletus edulis]